MSEMLNFGSLSIVIISANLYALKNVKYALQIPQICPKNPKCLNIKNTKKYIKIVFDDGMSGTMGGRIPFFALIDHYFYFIRLEFVHSFPPFDWFCFHLSPHTYDRLTGGGSTKTVGQNTLTQ